MEKQLLTETTTATVGQFTIGEFYSFFSQLGYLEQISFVSSSTLRKILWTFHAEDRIQND